MAMIYGDDFRARLRAGEGAADSRSVMGPEDFADDSGGVSSEELITVASGRRDLHPPPQAQPPAAPAPQAVRLDDGASSGSGRSWTALHVLEQTCVRFCA